MSDSISDKDKEDWIRFIKSNEKIHDKENLSRENKNFRTKSIDLHGYSLDEANKKIEILEQCRTFGSFYHEAYTLTVWRPKL